MFKDFINSDASAVTQVETKKTLSSLLPENRDLQQEENHCLHTVVRQLENSPTARALLRFAAVYGGTVGIDPFLEPGACFFYAQKNHFDIGWQSADVQKTDKGINRNLTAMIGGLRRLWHLHHGTHASFSLKPADFLRHCRYENADIESILCLIAWEMRAAGQAGLWRSLLGQRYADIAIVFETQISGDAYTQFDGRALRAAHQQWFMEAERIEDHDRQSLELLDMVLSRLPLPAGFAMKAGQKEDLERIGLLPNALNYLLNLPEGRLTLLSASHLVTGSKIGRYLQDIEKDIEKSQQKTV